MKTYTRWLFAIAAVTNLAVAALLLFFRGWAVPRAGLDPASGTNAVLLAFVAVMIGLFGYCYVRIALEPARFRPLIHVMGIGKLLAFACAALPYLAGTIGARLPTLVSADVVFALLFFDYLRRTRAAAL